MLADYHVHTAFSCDSEAVMEKVVKEAIVQHIEEICFTDHVDYGVKIDHDTYQKMTVEEQWRLNKELNVDYPAYFDEINRLQKKYKKRIRIKAGLEFGMQTHTISQFRELFDSYPFDFVLLSCHQVEDKEFWSNEFQNGKTPEEYNHRYYQEIYECICEYKDYSVLGHLDMIQRYNKTRFPFNKSRVVIEKILAQVIDDRKGLEVNTSSFRYGINDLMPARDILKLYHDMGGTIITIGSDAHKSVHLAEEIPYVKEELKKIGFKYFCTYVKMTPIFREL